MTGTCVSSPTSENRFWKSIWNHFCNILGKDLSTLGVYACFYLKAIPGRYARQIYNLKVISYCLLSSLFPFSWCIKSKFWLNWQCKSLFNLLSTSKIVKWNVCMHTEHECDLEWQVPWFCYFIYIIIHESHINFKIKMFLKAF